MADSIDPRVGIGHVHLKVADLDRALAFYHGVLGFEVTQRMGARRRSSAPAAITTTSASTRGRATADPPPRGTTGLYHVAILYPDRAALADALRRLVDAGVRLDGAADHGVSEALYLRDPDGNGVELYRDRPREAWPRTASGELAMGTEPLDLAALLAETGARIRSPAAARATIRRRRGLHQEIPGREFGRCGTAGGAGSERSRAVGLSLLSPPT